MVNDLSGIDDLELMPLGGGYMVRRERLMNELIAKGRKAGIVVLYAPDGFGKTSVLLQYTHEVKCDPTRGPVRIIEADRAIGREVFMQLEVVTEELKDKPHSLIAIDNVPNLDQHDTEDLIDRIRGLRAMGVGVFISCRPSNRQLIHGLGDSVKINAQMLKVHAYEYSAWASAFFDQHIARLLSAHAGRARARFGIADGAVWPGRRRPTARKRDCQRIWRGTCRSGFARQ